MILDVDPRRKLGLDEEVQKDWAPANEMGVLTRRNILSIQMAGRVWAMAGLFVFLPSRPAHLYCGFATPV